MLWIQRRFLSRCADLLRTETAQTYFQIISAKLNALQKDGNNESRINDSASITHLETVTTLARRFYDKLGMLTELDMLLKEGNDAEIQKIAKLDSEQLTVELDSIVNELTDVVIPVTEYDSLNNCQLEIIPGVGGVEASLFASELAEMYHNYAQFMKWKWTPYQVDASPSGGIRSAVVFVRGNGAFRALRYEAGVHRVQRFPVTDKTRMHTSTSVVAVLPEPEKIEACVTPADVKVETMRASGPGGQNVNQRSTAVRLTHRETGIAVHCVDERTQYSNMEIAYKRLAAILLQRKLDETQKQYSSSRKLQVGTKARAEKVRTYNFKDDQVIDHRLGKAWQGVANVMKGSSVLDQIIQSLDELSKAQHLKEILSAEDRGAKHTSFNV
ncbi:peptidyl-tRNA hydrolase domain-containing protein [Loa loa]|uniref:Peptidyl-tRNA hydrolase domain-containing protein n=1 Tax=Loa loa TaxID=7209 RepID=A0A1I7VHC3_LOALO|nr:peptidyl-tRNA hydrolase domain-containing protein [Loa loa]EFO20432.1 peptidyl-tRNA hydrolase domain-containing protein [Loa loa]